MVKYYRFGFVLLIALLLFTTNIAQDGVSLGESRQLCPGTSPSFLSLGARGTTTTDVRLRSGPGTNNSIIFEMNSETEFDVVGGYECGSYVWWQIQLADGTVGWAAEGFNDAYFLTPLDSKSQSSQRQSLSTQAQELIGIWENTDSLNSFSYIGFYQDGTVVFVPSEGDLRGTYQVNNNSQLEMDLVSQYGSANRITETIDYILTSDTLNLSGNLHGTYARIQRINESDIFVCPDSMESRILVGFGGQTNIQSDSTVNLRIEPSTQSQTIDRIQPGRRFYVIDGPQCAEGYTWWFVQLKDLDTSGWIAEGINHEYFIDPFPVPIPTGTVSGPELIEESPEYTLIKLAEFSIDTYSVEALAFSPDSRILAVGDSNGQVILWDVENSEQLKVLNLGQFGGRVYSLAFSPDGHKMALGVGKSLILWDINEEQPQAQVDLGVSDGCPLHCAYEYPNDVFSLEFSPDGNMIATGSRDGLRFWDSASLRLLGSPLQGHAGSIMSLAFSPDGQTVVTGGGEFDGKLILWDVVGRYPMREWVADNQRGILNTAFVVERNILMAISSVGHIFSYNVETGETLDSMMGDRGKYLGFNVTGNLVAGYSAIPGSYEYDTTKILLWDMITGTQVGSMAFEEAPYMESQVAFSPNNQFLTVVRWSEVAKKSMLSLLRLSDYTPPQTPDEILIDSYGLCRNTVSRDTDTSTVTLENFVQGFSFASASCDPIEGFLSNRVLVWGGKDGNAMNSDTFKSAYASSFVEVEYLPTFTGVAQIQATVSVSARVVAAAGSSSVFLDENDALAIVADVPTVLGALATIAEGLTTPSFSGLKSEVFLGISSTDNETVQTIGGHGFVSSFPVPPFSQGEDFSSEIITIYIDTPVIQGETINIRVGIRTEARAAGWAGVHWNLLDRKSYVESIIIYPPN